MPSKTIPGDRLVLATISVLRTLIMELDRREMHKDRQQLEWLEKLKSPEGLVWLANPAGLALRKSLNWLYKHENLERQRGQPEEWLEKLKAPDAATRKTILVENPARLYGF